MAHFGAGQFRPKSRAEVAALSGVTEDVLRVRAVGGNETPRLILVEKPPAFPYVVDLVVETVPGEIAAGQRRHRSPAWRHRIEQRQLRYRLLRTQPRGRDIRSEERRVGKEWR